MHQFLIVWLLYTNLFIDKHAAELFSNSSSLRSLKHDEAILTVKSQSKSGFIILEGVTTNCFECNLQFVDEKQGVITTIVDTRFPFTYAVYFSTNQVRPVKYICSQTYHFGEHGSYQIDIVPEKSGYRCSEVKEVEKPVFTYLSLVVMFCILAFLIFLANVAAFFWRKRSSQRESTRYSPIGSFDQTFEESQSSRYGAIPKTRVMSAPVPATDSSQHQRKSRLRSLDTFRGISIIIMIFVNYEGGGYWFFQHSSWNGLTVADLVFPWFIFIMGTSIFISCRSLRRKRINKWNITRKIVERTIKLFMLGLFINNGYDHTNWRIPGVLQRFALSYFVVAMMNLWLSPDEDVIDVHYHYDWRDALRDLTWYPLQHFIIVILLIAYLLIIFLAHDGQCPRGYFGAGGLSEHSLYYNCTGGITGYIDRQVFGLHHMYQYPTCKKDYNCIAFDPEGILGTIPSIILTYLGLQASRSLFLYSRHASHLKRWVIWSILLGVISIGLCGGRQNTGLIPINKNLWSLSYILAMASLAFLLLSMCYYLIDVKHWWSGTPFHYGGMNAILLYAGHELLEGYFPFNFKNNNQHDELLTQSCVGAALWTLIAFACYRRTIFIKL